MHEFSELSFHALPNLPPMIGRRLRAESRLGSDSERAADPFGPVSKGYERLSRDAGQASPFTRTQQRGVWFADCCFPAAVAGLRACRDLRPA
jgi:hypothetical protein